MWRRDRRICDAELRAHCKKGCEVWLVGHFLVTLLIYLCLAVPFHRQGRSNHREGWYDYTMLRNDIGLKS